MIFVGVVHEVPTKSSRQEVPKSVFIEQGYTKYGMDKSKQRWSRDRNLLLDAHLKDPTNSRTVLYLGLTEKWLDHNEIAYIYLKQRFEEMPAFEQENYYAAYNLAEVIHKLSREKPNKYSWDEACKYYMKAYALRPHRAEPLVQIARHYLKKGKHAVSYMFAKRACELDHPSFSEEVLSVLSYMYDFERWDILGQAAW